MKICILGDRKVGKTSLFNLLRGRPFTEAYEPTKDIQTCFIDWNYKTSDEAVRVEVWDVVDNSSGSFAVDALKMTERFKKERRGSFRFASADSSSVDVFRNTNAVILMFDLSRPETLTRASQILATTPVAMPVLILGNYRDSGVSTDMKQQVDRVLHEHASRPCLYYVEASMKNGFGLQALRAYFNVPFLSHKISQIQFVLREAEDELDRCKQEVGLLVSEQDYSQFERVFVEAQKNRGSVAMRSSSEIPADAPAESSASSEAAQHAVSSKVHDEDEEEEVVVKKKKKTKAEKEAEKAAKEKARKEEEKRRKKEQKSQNLDDLDAFLDSESEDSDDDAALKRKLANLNSSEEDDDRRPSKSKKAAKVSPKESKKKKIAVEEDAEEDVVLKKKKSKKVVEPEVEEEVIVKKKKKSKKVVEDDDEDLPKKSRKEAKSVRYVVSHRVSHVMFSAVVHCSHLLFLLLTVLVPALAPVPALRQPQLLPQYRLRINLLSILERQVWMTSFQMMMTSLHQNMQQLQQWQQRKMKT
jgi:hypothetical protein